MTATPACWAKAASPNTIHAPKPPDRWTKPALPWASPTAICQHPRSGELILAVQRDLYRLMAELSATPENAEKFHSIHAEQVNWLEAETDQIGQQVVMPREFIVPGDSPAGAALDLARTIVRRAERKVAQLVHMGELENIDCLRYLNRLSSLCFVLELQENQTAGKDLPTLAKP